MPRSSRGGGFSGNFGGNGGYPTIPGRGYRGGNGGGENPTNPDTRTWIQVKLEKEAQRLQKRISKNQFDFEDFLQQINQIRKMGNIKDLLGMIPGVGKAVKDIDIDDNALSLNSKT